MLFLKVYELMHELVKLYIGYDGRVLHVVQIVVFVQQFTQFNYPFCLTHFEGFYESTFFRPRIYA